LQIDPNIADAFKNDPGLFQSNLDKKQISDSEFKQYFFEGRTISEALSILNHFENNVLIAANKVVQFCHNQVGMLDGDGSYFSYSAIVGQSSSVIRKGEAIEIFAGIGAFSKAAKPTITVNGRNVDIGSDGIAVYRLPKATTAGKHFAKVIIEFHDENGEKQSIERTVNYTVLN
jgi:hypothetical protein